MKLFSILLIVSTALVLPIEQAHAQARASNEEEALLAGGGTAYRYGFESNKDEEFGDWPPGWTRRRGPNFPFYLPVSIQTGSAYRGEFFLRVQLNGGGAVMYSPPIACHALADYVLQGALRTSYLVNDRAFLSISFIDANRQILATHTSEGRHSTDGWRTLRVGPCRAPGAAATHIVIGLHLEPLGERFDINGSADFDDLWLVQSPRVSIELDDPIRIYAPSRDVILRCRTLGPGELPKESEIDAVDAFGKVVDAEFKRLQDKGQVEGRNDPAWKVQFAEPGFYRLRVKLTYEDGQVHRGDSTLVVVTPAPFIARSEFGWTLPHGNSGLPQERMVRLLRNVGISSVKMPVWIGDDMPAIGELIQLNRQLRTVGIELIGLLAEPPKEVLDKLRLRRGAPLADIMRQPQADWLPSLDPLMERLSWQIRSWQVANDRDTSLVSLEDATTPVSVIKQRLDTVGDDVALAISWPWGVTPPTPSEPAAKSPWRYLAISDASLDSAATLDEKLSKAPADAPPIWISLEPTSRQGGDLTARINDLIERIVTAKMHNVAGIFLQSPIRERSGVLTPDGSPGELLLPWRTTANQLAAAEYLGQLTLRKGSVNHVFVRDGRVVVVLSGGEPKQETMYWGSDVRQVDVWGRAVKPAQDGTRQMVDVRDLATFLVGADESVTRFRLAMQLVQQQLPSKFGVRQPAALRIENTFPGSLEGTLQIKPPEGWKVTPERIELRLAQGATAIVPFDWHVPLNGTSGEHAVAFEFNVEADRPYVFDAYTTVEVGSGQLQLFVESQLDSNGNLLVEQRIKNRTELPVSFKCHLYVPGQRRLRGNVANAAGSETVYTYTIPDGKALIGQELWLRAEEIGGSRILSQRCVAREKP